MESNHQPPSYQEGALTIEPLALYKYFLIRYNIILQKIFKMKRDLKLLNKKTTPRQVVDFMIVAGKLKWTKRSGWLEKGMPEPETVAEHTYRTTLLSAILASRLQLNARKLTAMAIFHDLAEGILGDPITERGRKKVGEHNIKEESRFMKNLFNNLGMPSLYKYWYENILENSIKKTKYSNALYQIGKIATTWQAVEYELQGVSRKVTQEFFENAEFHVNIPILKKILKSLKNLKKIIKKINYPFTNYQLIKSNLFEKEIINFMMVAGSLKWIKRSGWINIRVAEPETVAEHVYRVTILSRIIAPILNLNEERITNMAIFHDFAEGLFGDKMIEGNINKNQVLFLNDTVVEEVDLDVNKKKEFMKKFFMTIKLKEFYSFWEEQFQENDEAATFYSQIIFEIGKLANVWQAVEYELRGVPQNLTERFWQSANFYIKHPYLKEILKDLKKLRNSKKLII